MYISHIHVWVRFTVTQIFSAMGEKNLQEVK